MIKKDILTLIFSLHEEDIIEISEILDGYRETCNKSKKHTLLKRKVFQAGYKSITDFLRKNGFTKDTIQYKALNYETDSFSVYLSLKDLLSISDDEFIAILKEAVRAKNV